jgi:hypothetical protein
MESVYAQLSAVLTALPAILSGRSSIGTQVSILRSDESADRLCNDQQDALETIIPRTYRNHRT